MYQKPTDITIYTDGASRGNPGLGAWGFAVYLKGIYKGQKSKAVPHTTNNKMELQALIEALSWIAKVQKGKRVTIYTDSSYVQQGYKNWLGNWVKRNWRTASGTEVKNKDQWQEVVKLKRIVNNLVKVEKVPGHAGVVGNEKADSLCNERMEEFLAENRQC